MWRSTRRGWSNVEEYGEGVKWCTVEEYEELGWSGVEDYVEEYVEGVE